MFATNVDKMKPMDPHEDEDVNRYDLCIHACTKMLRGYPRSFVNSRGQTAEDLADARDERDIDGFVVCASIICGRYLLGVRMQTPILRRRSGSKRDEALRTLGGPKKG